MNPATMADIPRLVDMGRRFHAQSRMPFGFDPQAVETFLAGMIASDAGTIICGDHGAIGGMLAPAYCDPRWTMAVELFWWAERGGLALLRAFAEWAAAKGAQEVRMTSLAALPRADAVLRRKGYAPTEISYQKVI